MAITVNRITIAAGAAGTAAGEQMQGRGGQRIRQTTQAQCAGFNNRTKQNLYGFLERGRGDLKLKSDARPNAPVSFLKPNDKNYRGVVYAMRPLYCSKYALSLGTMRGVKKRIMRENPTAEPTAGPLFSGNMNRCGERCPGLCFPL